ncbi:transient receptor potential channel pyrexia-like [Anoplopoma fimbria]|uniref:transient receptor potential channel pyrexia-like n=1 Tax=Anoplopoma fimbria TaxID=229290 RepID=UPI0023EB68D4|nr:transient receptor potential channel pyrexia-like [Anoplopoma fimbria]
MKRGPIAGLTGLQNPGLELEMTGSINRIQVSLSQNQSQVQPKSESLRVSSGFGVSSGLGLSSGVQVFSFSSSEGCSSGVQLGIKYRGLADDDEGSEVQRDETDTTNRNQQLNKKLLNHFRQLAATNQDTDQVDFDFLDKVISEGADPNSSDRYGQTILHEISRAWSVDVMRFFLDRGSDLLRPDQFGVTALHVASALDYQDMVQFLLDRKGLSDPEARTFLDQQSPLHYAAKNDAVGSIRLLLKAGASVSCTDYKERTPLQLSANLERSEAARVLLELGAEAGTMDSDGQLCITALIGRMSPVAQLALSQFHVTDRMTRQEYFYLNLLEPEPHPPRTHQQEAAISEPTSPLEVVVHHGKLDLIMNPVFLKLIQVKWKLYGRLGAWLLLILNFLFNVSWTTVAISISVYRDSYRYDLPQDWWRVLLVVLALLLTLEEVLREIQDILRSRRKLRLWQRNVFDWLVYSLLTASFSVHMADVIRPSVRLHTSSLRLFSVTVIFLWLRLMKHVRAFRLMGPFIVMLGSIIGDVMRFLFLYAEIFIPYACSFWIVFGGSSTVPSMQSVSGLLYSLYRITLVDEYEYAAMVTVDGVMAPLLCGTFLAASSILCVNLLIALLTDTFQRVHGNSQAIAVMQQAAVILQVEESMPLLRRFYDNQFISNHCAPWADAHNDDITSNSRYHGEMGRITTQIKRHGDSWRFWVSFYMFRLINGAMFECSLYKNQTATDGTPKSRLQDGVPQTSSHGGTPTTVCCAATSHAKEAYTTSHAKEAPPPTTSHAKEAYTTSHAKEAYTTSHAKESVKKY